jgi:thymidylate synthase ThyX
MFALDCTRGGNWMYDKYEDFSEAQVKILNLYVTNTDSNIFALHNLPEVIKGALFSRYSRSSLGLRSLLLKEFILNEETAFKAISRTNGTGGEEAEIEDQIMAVKKAQNFYDRILDGYGDDSIGELGGAHLALENISMLAAKIIEDCRIGGSPLEKSTRYIYFDQKLGGEYLFHRESILMTSAFRDLYTSTCNSLFETYSQLIAPLTELMEKKFPKEHDISKVAYTAALRAKVLDCLRGLLPASALTNMGLYGNGRFFENLIQKLHAHNLVEMQETGKKSYTELAKIIPSFIRRSEPSNKYQQSFANYQEQMQGDLKMLAKKYTSVVPKMEHSKVELIGYDPDAPYKIAGALLFAESHGSLYEIQKQCKRLSSEELSLILDSACTFRENRRHKSPRALEHAYFTFEIVADFGIYRDLQRHRVLTQERQLLTCNYGYFVPQEIIGTEMQEAKKTYDLIAQELPEEAQYVVPMAYNIHWYFHVNLRQLQWICELRSSPAGHPAYRYIAQEMAKQVSTAFPMLERFFKFVDYDGYELGRLGQEIRTAEKMKARGHIL